MVNQRGKSLIFLNTAIVIWGIVPLFPKVLTCSVALITCLRCLSAAPALLLLLHLKQMPIRLNSRTDYGMMLLTGAFLGAHWLTYFYALRMASVAVGVIALCTTPIIIILLEPLFYGERRQLSDLLAGGIVLVGILILVPEFSLDNSVLRGLGMGILSAILFSLRNIISRQYVRKYTGITVMFYQVTVAGLLLTPVLFFAADWPTAARLPAELTAIILLGLLVTAGAHSLYISSLRGVKAKTAGLLQTLTPVYSVTIAFLVLGSAPTLREILGGLIIISAALYENLYGSKR